jgi:outer membrane lipoprotein-sorting protein
VSWVPTEQDKRAEGVEGNVLFREETDHWQQANLWRIDTKGSVVDAQGRPVPGAPGWEMISISDGQRGWLYDPISKQAVVNSLPAGMPNPPLVGKAEDLGAVLSGASHCFSPTLGSPETIAGRAAYALELGVSRCAEQGTEEASARRTIWVDQETYLVLQSELTDVSTGQILRRTEAQTVEYNKPFDASTFQFAPPPGVRVQDFSKP